METVIIKLQKICHDIFHWGFPDETIDCDGISLVSTCKFCGRKLLQDGQGNWFHC